MLLNKNLKFLPILEFINRDLIAVMIQVPPKDRRQEDAYRPGDGKATPPKEIQLLLYYCRVRKKQLIIGYDANAHHTIIRKWHVSEEESMSDHKQIRFDLLVPTPTLREYSFRRLALILVLIQ